MIDHVFAIYQSICGICRVLRMTMVLPTFVETKVGRAEGYSLNTNFRCKTPPKTNYLYYVTFQERYYYLLPLINLVIFPHFNIIFLNLLLRSICVLI